MDLTRVYGGGARRGVRAWLPLLSHLPWMRPSAAEEAELPQTRCATCDDTATRERDNIPLTFANAKRVVQVRDIILPERSMTRVAMETTCGAFQGQHRATAASFPLVACARDPKHTVRGCRAGQTWVQRQKAALPLYMPPLLPST